MRACQQLPHRLIIYLLMLTVAKHSWMGASRATRGRAENTALLQWNLRTCYDEMKLQEDQVMVISRSRTIRYFFPFSFLLKKKKYHLFHFNVSDAITMSQFSSVTSFPHDSGNITSNQHSGCSPFPHTPTPAPLAIKLS